MSRQNYNKKVYSYAEMREKELKRRENRLKRAAEATPEQVLDKAMELLGYRSRSESEMFKALTEKGYSEQLAAASVAKLVELGYLNDERYAEYLTEKKLRDGHGLQAIRYELRERGLSREIISNAVEGMQEEEIDSAVRCAEKYYEKYDSYAGRERRAKTIYALVNRGYTQSAAVKGTDLYISQFDDPE